MPAHDERCRIHSLVSARLASLSDQALSVLVEDAPPVHTGIGGRSAHTAIAGVQVFIKKVPLTDLERLLQNFRSTANLFELPTFCQYGLGGCPGFGAWRELAATERATDWVLTGACSSFPLVYHWRVLPRAAPAAMDAEQVAALERDVAFWEGSSAVRRRIEAVHNASAHLLLFAEWVPQNLLEWTTAEFAKGEAATAAAVAFVQRELDGTIGFMHAHGLTHFDTHFENILCDGERLYFTDFGLATSPEFDLTKEEREFLARHASYDAGRAAVGFLHSLSVAFLANCGAGDWKENAREYLRSGQPELPSSTAAALRRVAPHALAFLDFSRTLLESKRSVYPSNVLEAFLWSDRNA